MNRKTKLKTYKRVNLTKEGYKILRKHKTIQKKSMMKIVDELIKQLNKNEELANIAAMISHS